MPPREPPRTRRQGSGVRHERRSAQRQAPRRARRAAPTISAPPAAAPSSSPIRRSISRKDEAPAKPVRAGHDLHLPDASRRSARSAPAPARSAAWRWSRSRCHAPITGPNPELVDMQRRFWIGLALTVPVFVLEMGSHLFGWDHYIPGQVSNWVQLVLATPVVLWAGWPFFERGWRSVLTRNLNMFTLIALGTGVGLRLQRRRDAAARRLPRGVPGPRRLGRRCTSRPPPSSPCWCCSGRCSSCGRARAPAAPSARCSTSRRRRRGASRPTAARARSRSTRSSSAIACACARARRSPSTARSSKAAARSTNRW